MKHATALLSLLSLVVFASSFQAATQPRIPMPRSVQVLADRPDISRADRILISDFYRILATKVHGVKTAEDFVSLNISFGEVYFAGSGLRGKYVGLAEQVDTVLLEAIGSKRRDAVVDTEKLARYLMLISEAIRQGPSNE